MIDHLGKKVVGRLGKEVRGKASPLILVAAAMMGGAAALYGANNDSTPIPPAPPRTSDAQPNGKAAGGTEVEEIVRGAREAAKKAQEEIVRAVTQALEGYLIEGKLRPFFDPSTEEQKRNDSRAIISTLDLTITGDSSIRKEVFANAMNQLISALSPEYSDLETRYQRTTEVMREIHQLSGGHAQAQREGEMVRKDPKDLSGSRAFVMQQMLSLIEQEKQRSDQARQSLLEPAFRNDVIEALEKKKNGDHSEMNAVAEQARKHIVVIRSFAKELKDMLPAMQKALEEVRKQGVPSPQ